MGNVQDMTCSHVWSGTLRWPPSTMSWLPTPISLLLTQFLHSSPKVLCTSPKFLRSSPYYSGLKVQCLGFPPNFFAPHSVSLLLTQISALLAQISALLTQFLCSSPNFFAPWLPCAWRPFWMFEQWCIMGK